MDSAELNQRLQPFFKSCAEKGKAIEKYTIEEAYPGDPTTSYFVNVKSAWLDTLSTSEALDILFDTLWETADVETRTKVFAIKLFKSNKELKNSQPITINSGLDFDE